MLQRIRASRLEAYLRRRHAFDPRRRELRLSFDQLFDLFNGEESSADIARRARVSKERINVIFNRHFSDLLGMTASERRRRKEQTLRDDAARKVAATIAKDRLLIAIRQSAQESRSKPRIEPVFGAKRARLTGFRRKAVLVNGRSIESVHHIRKSRPSGSGTRMYGSTTLYRSTLERSGWTIFVVDVPHYPRRVIRSRNTGLLRSFFDDGQTRVSIYIPLQNPSENPRYDFLADEDNWG
jgi:hypothetical protein